MKQKSWFEKHKAIGITLIIIGAIVLTSLLIYLFVPNEFFKNSTDSPSGSSYSPAEDINISAIEPKKQEPLNTLYSEDDAKNAIAEAKGMADKADQKIAFFDKYSFTSVGNKDIKLIIFTPYANTAMSVASLIEKYDSYTLDQVTLALNSNKVYTTVSNLITNKAYYKWNTEDLRAAIEYDSGQVCKGEIDDANSEYSGMDDNYNLLYKTSISATFSCYSDVRNKIVTFAYVLGSEKFRFTDIDMSKLK